MLRNHYHQLSVFSHLFTYRYNIHMLPDLYECSFSIQRFHFAFFDFILLSLLTFLKLANKPSSGMLSTFLNPVTSTCSQVMNYACYEDFRPLVTFVMESLLITLETLALCISTVQRAHILRWQVFTLCFFYCSQCFKFSTSALAYVHCVVDVLIAWWTTNCDLRKKIFAISTCRLYNFIHHIYVTALCTALLQNFPLFRSSYLSTSQLSGSTLSVTYLTLEHNTSQGDSGKQSLDVSLSALSSNFKLEFQNF